jgi:hypothetical protein
VPDTAARLVRNNVRRGQTERTLESLRTELAQLLAQGKKEGLPVSHMAALAGISRETAHKLLREGGGDG